MARSQGLYRLSNGVTRIVHKSESERGYIFITKDKALLDECNNQINVFMNGSLLGNETIDKFGRIFPKNDWRKKLKTSKSISLKLKDGTKSIDIQLN